MILLQISKVLIVSIFFSWYVGYGLTKLLLPSYLKDLEILFSLYVGISIVVLLSHLLGILGLSGETITWGILALAMPLNLYYLLRNERSVIVRNNILPLVVAAPALFFALYPVVNIGYLTVTSPNGDPVGYSLVADYLQKNGLPKTYELPQDIYLAQYYNRFAFSYFSSLIDTLLGLKGYQAFPVLTAFFLYLNAISAYLVCRVLGIRTQTSNLAVFLIAINSYLLILHFQGFAPQLIGMSFISLSTICVYLSLERKGDTKTVILTSLFCSTLIAAYSDAIAFVLLPAIGFLIWFLAKECAIVKHLTTYSKIAFLSIAINLPGTIWAYILTVNRMHAGTAGAAGNVSAFEKIPAAYGMYASITIWDWLPNTSMGWVLRVEYWPTAFLLFPIMAFISLYGLLRSSTHVKTYVGLVGCSFIIFIVMSYYVTPYIYFKTLSLSVYLFLILLADGTTIMTLKWKEVSSPYGKILAGFSTVSLTALIFLNILNSAAINRMFIEKKIFLDSSTIGLKDASDKLNMDRAIYIPFEGTARQWWEVYFLSFSNLKMGAKSNDSIVPFTFKQKDSDFVLLRLKNVSGEERDELSYESIWRNDSYMISKKKENVVSVIDRSSLSLFPVNVTEKNLARIEFNKEDIFINGQKYEVGAQKLRQIRSITIEYAAMEDIVWADIRNISGKILPSGIKRVSFSIDSSATYLLKSQEPFVINRLVFSRDLTPYIRQEIGHQAILAKSAAKRDEISTKLKFYEPLSRDISISMDAYNIDNHTHPEGHFGWWAIQIDRGQGVQNIEFVFNPENKSVKGVMEGRVVELSKWIGPANDGEFSAVIVLRLKKREEPLKIIEVFNFRLSNGNLEDVSIQNGITPLSLFQLKNNMIDLGIESSDRFLTDGWSHREKADGIDFVWGIGKESEIALELPLKKYKSLELVARPYTPSSYQQQTQTVTIFVDSEIIGTLELRPGWQTYQLSLPISLPLQKEVVLKFVYGYHISPLESGESRDDRQLAIAFDYIKFLEN